MTTPEAISRAMSGQVKAAVKAAGISQADLAARTGISLAALSRKLNHRAPFKVGELGAISEALGVSLTVLAQRAEQAA